MSPLAAALVLGLLTACHADVPPAEEPVETFHSWGKTTQHTRGRIPPATPLPTLQAVLDSWPDAQPPAAWDRSEIAAAALPTDHVPAAAPDAEDACILAWRIVRDGRPLLIEECLVLLACRSIEGEPGFVLASMYRHPAYANVWRVSEVSDGVHCGLHLLTSKPTPRDALNLVNDSHWLFDVSGPTFGEGTDWETLQSGVCRDAWEACLGAGADR